MKKMVLAVSAVGAIGTAQGQLAITIDTLAETIAFSGQDAGRNDANRLVEWSSNTPLIGGTSFVAIDDSFLQSVPGIFDLGPETGLTIYDNGSIGLSLQWTIVFNSPVTPIVRPTGSGLVSYASLDPAGKAALAAADGLVLSSSTVPATANNTWDDITVSVVPAPSSVAVLGVAGLAASRRRR